MSAQLRLNFSSSLVFIFKGAYGPPTSLSEFVVYIKYKYICNKKGPCYYYRLAHLQWSNFFLVNLGNFLKTPKPYVLLKFTDGLKNTLRCNDSLHINL